MKIPDKIRKTVAFLAYKNELTGELKPVGSVFILTINNDGGAIGQRAFFVTARHVIDGLKRNAVRTTYVRMNAKPGLEPTLISMEVEIGDWVSCPDDQTIDVAMVERGIPHDADHLAIPETLGATSEKMAENEVDLGDEVFISGLFQHHYGNSKNIPIIRIGNLSALNEERIFTKQFGEIDAYLIECRSIGGLSGSPVFLNLNMPRAVGGAMRIGGGDGLLLLGLVHGHFDVQADVLENMIHRDAGLAPNTVNAGMAVVVPFHSIMKTVPRISFSAPRSSGITRLSNQV